MPFAFVSLCIHINLLQFRTLTKIQIIPNCYMDFDECLARPHHLVAKSTKAIIKDYLFYKIY